VEVRRLTFTLVPGHAARHSSPHRSHRRVPFVQKLSIGVIGGGVAGLTFAHRFIALRGDGARLTVYDTGKHAVGGRASSRAFESRKIAVDHAAQVVVPNDAEFVELIDLLAKEGAMRKWETRLGVVGGGGAIEELWGHDADKWVGSPNMGAVCKALVRLTPGLHVRRPQWVAKIVRSKETGQWSFFNSGGRVLGRHDVVVIAHNGKCADRLLRPTGAKRIHQICRAEFVGEPRDETLQKLQLTSLWSLAAALDAESAENVAQYVGDYGGVFVRGSGKLSWFANNGSKSSNAKGVWTLLSSPSYAAANKVPQEAIPEDTAARIQAEMLQEFQAAIKCGHNITVDDSLVQLWGAALPVNQFSHRFAFDPAQQIAVCGDWMGSSASLETAALSGELLAKHLSRSLEVSHGLEGRFENCPTDTPIGTFKPRLRCIKS